MRSYRTEKDSRPIGLPDPLSLSALVQDFTERLTVAVELGVAQRGQELIESIFSHIAEERSSQQGAAERRRLVSSWTDELMNALEQPINEHMRELFDRQVGSRPSARQAERDASSAAGASADGMPVRRRIRRARPKPLPPPPDPEQIKRDAEAARLRALLKPTADEPPPAPAFVPSPPPPRPVSPGDVLRALEKEIQDAVPSLATLGPERCGAQIAVWTGLIRQLRDRLPADVAATMRPAFRIFLEHLTQLRVAMEAHLVDALEHNWSPPDWDAYIEANRARIEQRPAHLPADKLEAYHRAMLKTLVMPHRRNIPQQAVPIILAAAKVLPPDDSQLRSAKRRHASVLEPQQAAPAPEAATPGPAESRHGAEYPAKPTREQNAPDEQAPEADDKTTSAPPAEDDFDSLWTK